LSSFAKNSVTAIHRACTLNCTATGAGYRKDES
jgi:hypothetical protein